jgi:hypothetical protein
MIGGQDYSDTPTPRATFQAKVANFATTLRTRYPNALIMFAVGPQLKDSYPVGYMVRTNVRTAFENVVNAKVAGGDAKFTAYTFTESLPPDETGCYQHAGPALHVKMADEISPVLRAKLNW